MKRFYCVLTVLVLLGLSPKSFAQNRTAAAAAQSFEQIEMIVPDGDKLREVQVRVRFETDSVALENPKTNEVLKRFAYADLKSAEYSYSKNPRWKTGLGLGAASVLFPPLFLVAIPIGFTKHRRHWLTVRGEKDYAVLKIGKSIRKVFVPAFETSTGIAVEAMGESK